MLTACPQKKICFGIFGVSPTNLMWGLNYAISWTNILHTITLGINKVWAQKKFFLNFVADWERISKNWVKLHVFCICTCTSSVHVHNNQHYRWISVCSGASMGATLTLTPQYSLLEYIFSSMWRQNNALRENGEIRGNTWAQQYEKVPARLPIVGRWKLPGISGKYPQVSGESIPQISSYIHVTPHLCARGTLNSVTCQ